MVATKTRYGIPDVELERLGDGSANPADFIGHELLVLFCPADPDAAARDVADYARHAPDLCDSDAWIVGICDEKAPSCAPGPAPFTMVRDRDQIAWTAFQDLLPPRKRTSREGGAVFLFDRGGGMRRRWAGSGHAAEVMRALRERR